MPVMKKDPFKTNTLEGIVLRSLTGGGGTGGGTVCVFEEEGL